MQHMPAFPMLTLACGLSTAGMHAAAANNPLTSNKAKKRLLT